MMNAFKVDELRRSQSSSRGFSLIELMVAVGIFLLISAVSFDLFSRHQAVMTESQLTVSLNIGLRSALSQIQLDVANAGNGLVVGTNLPYWPVGVTIENSTDWTSTPACNPTASYPPVYVSGCFDQLNIIVADATTPPLHPCEAIACSVVTSGTSTGTLTGYFASAVTAQQLTQYASNFKSGDSILFLNACAATGGKSSVATTGCPFTTAVLTSTGTGTTTGTGCSNGCVTLSYNLTSVGGGNPVCSLPTTFPTSCNDPYNMTSHPSASMPLTDTFYASDWVVHLTPVTYSVDANYTDTQKNPDPRLMRTQNGTSNAVMDQIISFKVGAALWNNTDTSSFQYFYDAASYGTGSGNLAPASYQYNLIRSVRVSLIGRTEPNSTLIARTGTNSSTPSMNDFDNGPYLIRGNSMIIDPRNLTMNAD